ncbi:MAG: response regulator [Lautropia sp.]
MIRALVCDDHQIVRQGIRQILADAGDVEVGAEAANGPDAIRSVREAQRGATPFDVVLLDIAMPGRDGLDVLKQLKSEFPRLPVLILSTYPDKQYAVRSMKLGAAGYLNKSADGEQMVAAVRKVAGGSRYITPSAAEALASAIGSGTGDRGAPAFERFSHREYQVFRLLTSGLSVGEIATRLSLSSNTVSTYRARLLEKTGARNDVELALYAVQSGLL